MENWVIQQIDIFQTNGDLPNTLYALFWTLTPDAQSILESILPDHPKTLLELAAIANQDLNNFWNNIVAPKNYTYPILSNIFQVDNYKSSNVVEIVTRGLIHKQ